MREKDLTISLVEFIDLPLGNHPDDEVDVAIGYLLTKLRKHANITKIDNAFVLSDTKGGCIRARNGEIIGFVNKLNENGEET